MEDLKKKIVSMTPYNAFLAHAGIALLVLVLFLFVGMVKPKTPKANNDSRVPYAMSAQDYEFEDYNTNFRDYGYEDIPYAVREKANKSDEPTFTGANILFNKSESGSDVKITFGVGSIFCWFGCIALLISLIYSYKKQMIDWRISAVAFAGMLIGALTVTISVWESHSTIVKMKELDATPTALFWILVVATALWTAFGYFRGNNPVSFNQK